MPSPYDLYISVTLKRGDWETILYLLNMACKHTGGNAVPWGQTIDNHILDSIRQAEEEFKKQGHKAKSAARFQVREGYIYNPDQVVVLAGVVGLLDKTPSPSGQLIAKFKAEHESFIIQIDEKFIRQYFKAWLLLKGYWQTHPHYGSILQVIGYTVAFPTSQAELALFLGNGTVTGLGPKMVRRVIAEFGDKTFDVLNDGKHLDKVDGLGRNRVKMICDSWQERRAEYLEAKDKEELIYLPEYGAYPKIEVRGVVTSVVFSHPTSTLSIVNFKASDYTGLIKVLQYGPVELGIWVTIIEGSWVDHPDFGRVLWRYTFTLELPSSLQDFQTYLAAGFGDIIANRIVETFGPSLPHIIEKQVDKLLSVKGVTEYKVKALAKAWSQMKKAIADFQKDLEEMQDEYYDPPEYDNQGREYGDPGYGDDW